MNKPNNKNDKSLKEEVEECPFGCIFDMGKLHGDCRIPWSDKCTLNVRRKRKRDETSNS